MKTISDGKLGLNLGALWITLVKRGIITEKEMDSIMKIADKYDECNNDYLVEIFRALK